MTASSVVSWTFRFFGIVIVAVIWVLAVAWAAGAFHFDLPAPFVIRDAVAAVWLLGVTIAWFFVRPRARARAVVVCAFWGIIVWWLTIQARADSSGRA
jgi:hypothetical protein